MALMFSGFEAGAPGRCRYASALHRAAGRLGYRCVAPLEIGRQFRPFLEMLRRKVLDVVRRGHQPGSSCAEKLVGANTRHARNRPGHRCDITTQAMRFSGHAQGS